MTKKDNIAEMQPIFESLKRIEDNGEIYWSSRELSDAMGYSAYWKFSRVIDKAIKVASEKGMEIDHHFNRSVEMVRLGSGAYRKVELFHLSKLACLIIAENADSKKALVQQARQYFSATFSSLELIDNSQSSNILFYKSPQGEARIEVIFNSETFWMSQKRMASLFGVDVRTINHHLIQIFESGELDKSSTIRKIGIVQTEGNRDVERTPLFYNLDAIIAVGYRVNSYQATQFRIWASSVLKEFIVKGFVLDDERLKQGRHFGKDYFDDLLERIREIRTSERRYYQKITDIYAECSIDYDSRSEDTKQFFKMVQNMMHLAVTNHTAAEIIYDRANADMLHMGLTSWKKAPDGRIQKSDTEIAKNYLSVDEISQLNAITTSFLDLAEARARRHIPTKMSEWKERLQAFLVTMDYTITPTSGTVTHTQAIEKAHSEYDKYRLIQDKTFITDFDRFLSTSEEDLLPLDDLP
ncbi:MAG: virulence RhuM family protein [Muribaculaceae bacterium]|nr:virulence RhuM family protein [Muribaculaceae bacterium]